MLKLVVHVPHASFAIPDDAWPELLFPRAAVEAEALESADLHTDEMAKQAWPLAEIVEADVSRIVVDVERYDDDSKEEMAEVGRGVFYACDHQMRPIRNALTEVRRDELLDRYYRPHWKHLRAKAADAVLVDPRTTTPVPACRNPRLQERDMPTYFSPLTERSSKTPKIAFSRLFE
ncbi:putative N-formylglutamate amidohydrolase family protein [Octadecabacter arcticus 238]|uniref:Putative N-formylglutamate amidohydrolase family protein n=1 Tax=Octadecabacter arcticus 238 TaxID=391616 RepID=M9RVP2_9RHOB|nr:N-formylglutamate amidohydrolase [Octadecabacter arcticus]AGI73890.1 putative N-formylglutamate amidohydrolase family protein [Octadecabacter arcticus 238]